MQNSEENAVHSGHWKALNTKDAEVSTLPDGDSGSGWNCYKWKKKRNPLPFMQKGETFIF